MLVSLRKWIISAILICAFALGALADSSQKKQKPPKDMPTILCERGKLLFSDDFTDKDMSKNWKIACGHWVIVDGTLNGTELEQDNHAAVIRCPLEFRNIVAQFCIKFDGGNSANFTCNKSGLGHVCRMSLTPTGFSVNKVKPNKESTEVGRVLDTVKFEFKKGQWYTVLVEIFEEEIVASVDVKNVRPAFGEHPGVAMEKSEFTLSVSGGTVLFDEVRVWEAQPSKRWKSIKKKLEYTRRVMEARESVKQQKE